MPQRARELGEDQATLGWMGCGISKNIPSGYVKIAIENGHL